VQALTEKAELLGPDVTSKLITAMKSAA